jgi:hypothetical protein
MVQSEAQLNKLLMAKLVYDSQNTALDAAKARLYLHLGILLG